MRQKELRHIQYWPFKTVKYKSNFLYYFVVYGFFILLIAILGIIYATQKTEFITPCPEAGCVPIVTPTPTNTPQTSPMPVKSAVVSGLASYYSREGCLGCSDTLTMANGQPLDDSKLTVAYNRAPLNSQVKITNTKNGKSVIARVTDTGGFERHGKIVDLTIATRDAIGCGSTCSVEITKI